MKIIKTLPNGKYEFTDEVLTILAIVASMLFACQLIMELLSRSCKRENLTSSFFQKHKQTVNDATRYFRLLHTTLSKFDGWFDDMMDGKKENCDYLQRNANDVVKLLLLFYSRTENHEEKRERIFSIIRSFDQEEHEDFNALFNYFNVKL